MQRLDRAARARVLGMMVEGMSIRSIVRLTGVSKNTVVKLLADAGTACRDYMDVTLVNLPCRRIQCDEIWSFVGAKEKNVKPERRKEGIGSIWTWTAIDAHSKLVPTFHVGTRDAACASEFMQDV